MCLFLLLGKAKIEKRARRDLYEGSKLLDQHRKQVSSALPQQRQGFSSSNGIPAKL